jgi:diguanylate cyclase (GGDEF)-like protein
MLDVDAFKAVNDRYGHGTGDQVLARVAAACTAQLRAGIDLCGRLGGEEFAILLPETTRDGAVCLAERLRAAIGEQLFQGAGQPFRVSVSIGVGTLNGDDESFAALLARADAALYQAKLAGRDRVEMATG